MTLTASKKVPVDFASAILDTPETVSTRYVPYDYQEPFLAALKNARRRGKKRALIVMASGLGKTAVVGFDLRTYLKKRLEARFLCLCDQNRILEQDKETIAAIIGEEGRSFGFYHGLKKESDAQFLFASFQTMCDHLSEFARDEFSYIVVDESHHAHANTYRPVVEYFDPEFLLGITATPDRKDMRDIRQIFGVEVASLDLPEALARGYLTPVDYRLVADTVVELGHIENPLRLTLKELNRKIFIPRRDDEIARIVSEKAAEFETPRIIIFCNSINHAERFAKHLPGAVTIHSRLSTAEQQRRLEAFEQNQIHALATVDQFNEGVDFPDLNIIVFLRSTESRRIFFQQLGRGLRRAPRKSKVLALDFVGNCDRIRLVDSLRKEIGRRQELDIASNGSGLYAGSLVWEFGNFEFTEELLNILDLIHQKEMGYTRDLLIQILKAEEQMLGHPPRLSDIEAASRQGRSPGRYVYVRVFGSWPQALIAAGMRPYKAEVPTRELLLIQIKAEGDLLGREPRYGDIQSASKAGRTSSLHFFRKEFGSLHKAWLAATGTSPRTAKEYTDEELLGQLRTEAEYVGVPLTSELVADASRAGRTFGVRVFQNRFGSITNAFIAAGLREKGVEYSPAALIQQLQHENAALGHSPSTAERRTAYQEGRMASDATLKRAFGSVRNAYSASGLPVWTIKNNAFHNSGKIELFKQFDVETARLGHPPSQADINRSHAAGRTASYRRFCKVFGSWNALLELRGITPPKPKLRYKKSTRDEMLEQIAEATSILDRPPSIPDWREMLQSGHNYAGVSAITKEFGSWNKAILAAGERPNRQRHDRASLIQQLKALNKKLGRRSTSKDIIRENRAGNMAGIGPYTAEFGSLANAHAAAGVLSWQEERKRRSNPKQIIAQVDQLAEDLGHSPTQSEWKAAYQNKKVITSLGTINAVFGSLNNAVLKAGRHPALNQQQVTLPPRDELIYQLRKVCADLGRHPTRKEWADLTRAGKMYALNVFLRTFGSIPNAHKEAGT